MKWKGIINLILGRKPMAALQSGSKAPAISLKTIDGESMSLAEALKKGPVLVAFFKVSCPVCQFTFPFLERLHEKFGGGKFTLWGISQNDREETVDFAQQFGIRFPMLLDTPSFEVSNQYKLTNVPSLFFIQPSGKIGLSSVGFAKADIEQIAKELGEATASPAFAIFRPGEVVPAYKPG